MCQANGVGFHSRLYRLRISFLPKQIEMFGVWHSDIERCPSSILHVNLQPFGYAPPQ